MKNLNGIEELIRVDCDKMIRILTEIEELYNLTSDKSEFKKAKELWKEYEKLAFRLQKLDYKEEHMLPIVRKEVLLLLEKVQKEIKEEV